MPSLSFNFSSLGFLYFTLQGSDKSSHLVKNSLGLKDSFTPTVKSFTSTMGLVVSLTKTFPLSSFSLDFILYEYSPVLLVLLFSSTLILETSKVYLSILFPSI